MLEHASAPATVRVDVALIPELAGLAPAQRGTVYVVVDVIRATTTLSVLFERGCRRLLIAPDIASARSAHARADEPKPLLAGETGGIAPPGFDCGNSPTEIAAREVTGREVIFATTNGTRALRACAGGGAIFAGAFRNARAVATAALAASARLRAIQPPAVAPATTGAAPAEQASEAASPADLSPDIVIVCSGRTHAPSYDDTLCAGYLVREVVRQAVEDRLIPHSSEGARIASAVLDAALATQSAVSHVTDPVLGEAFPGSPIPAERLTHEWLRNVLAGTDAGRAIARVGLAGDLDWCAAVDAATVVPRVASDEAGLLIMTAE